MLGNHLVSELLRWKVEFFLSLTARWYISNKHNRSYFGDDPVAYPSHRGQQQNIRFRMKWQSRHTGLHTSQTHKTRARSRTGLPQLQSKYSTCHIICKKKVNVWKISISEKRGKLAGGGGGILAAPGVEAPKLHSQLRHWLTLTLQSYLDSPCPGSPVSTMGIILHPVLKRQLLLVKYSGNLD